MLKKKTASRLSCLLLSFTLAFGTNMTVVPAAAQDEVTFNTLGSGYYYSEGLPLFDGNPDHLDEYVDTYLDWVGLEGACLYAAGLRDAYKLTTGTHAGAVIPGGLAAADNVQGVSTDFPALVGMGQSWNRDLLADIGDVMGSEKMSTLLTQMGISRNNHNGKDYNGAGSYPYSRTIAFTAVHDLRINPLSGRIDESYAEDPFLVSTLIDSMATGFTGLEDGKSGTTGTSDDGFYTRGIVGTKHFSVYNAQWYRQTSSTSASPRSIYEYQIVSALKGLASGSIAGIMNSFGRTNGIPNEIASYNLLAGDIAKYGMYASPDFNGENQMYTANAMGNGYDTKYVPDRKHALALMVLAGIESVRASGTDKTDALTLKAAVDEGVYGLTEQDVREAATPLLNQMVRAGLFDELDASGYPKYYPYVDQSKDGAVADDLTSYATASHQAVALQAAQESIVLLKNDGDALPLEKADDLAVAGVLADSRFKTTYAVGTTPSIADAGETPLLSIVKSVDEATGSNNSVTFDLSVPTVAIQAPNGLYLTAATDAGADLQATFAYDATTNPFTNAQLFEVFDWGQGAVSIRSKLNGRWITAPSAASTAVGNTNSTALNLTNSDWDLATMTGTTSAIPPRLMQQDMSGGRFAIVSNEFSSGFGGGFEAQYWNARFLTLDAADQKVKTASGTTSTQSGTPTDSQSFAFTVVEEASADITARAATADTAVIFVGALPRNSAGEGCDRSTLAMADGDYDLVKEAAAAFAAQGKKTVVVLKTSFPVLAGELQNDDNVCAILYQPYAGQYDGKALAQVLFGDVAPSGRLTSTWYDSDDVLDDIDAYSIPEGNTKSLSQLDIRITKDMTNADPAETGLTYMYAGSSHITYPFGYGLSYSSFSYGVMTAPDSVSAGTPFTVTVPVTNTGDVGTSEVVQLYMHNTSSAYGSEVPKKKLVAYEKVAIGAGETESVTLTVDPQDLAIWDVNLGDWIVEDGLYDLMVGASSADIRCESEVAVSGDTLASLDPAEAFSAFDHSFASNDVVYRETGKGSTVASLKADKVAGGYSVVMSKNDDSWVAIPKVELAKANQVTARVATTNAAGGTIRLALDSPDGPVVATISVPQTSAVTYLVDSVSVSAYELGYATVTADFSADIGTHDLYVLFDEPDLRIDTLQIGLAAPAIRLSGAATVDPDAEFPVTVSLGGTIEDIYAEDFTVAYDKSLFTYVGAEAADPDIMIASLTEGDGTVKVIAANAGGVTGAADILKLTFRAASTESTTPGAISVTEAELGSPLPLPTGTVLAAQGGTLQVAIAKNVVPVETVTIDQGETHRMTVGDTGILTATVLPGNATNPAVTWSSGNPDVLSVDALTGAIVAKTAGTAVVTATAGSATDFITVTVQAPVIPATGVRLDQSSIALAVGGSATLTATLTPTGSTGELVWSSSDASVAEVVGGVVTAKAAGTVEIRAALKSDASLYASCTVTVRKVGDISDNGSVDVGDLAVAAYWYGAKTGDANWADAKAADVNADGVVDILDLALIARGILLD